MMSEGQYQSYFDADEDGESFRAAVIAARQRDIMKALKGVLHHNDAVKVQYKLPESLIRQVKQAILLHEGNVKGEF